MFYDIESGEFDDKAKQNAYMNACDCLYYGYSKEFWNDCGIAPEERNEVWRQARLDVGV